MNRFKPQNYTGIFIVNCPKILVDTLIIGKKYKNLIVIISLSDQYSESLKELYKNLLIKEFSNIKIIEIKLKNQWYANRKLSIIESLPLLNKILYENIKTDNYDILCNPNCCPIAFNFSLIKKIFILQHDAIEFLNNMFPFIRKLYVLIKFKRIYKGSISSIGCIKINKLLKVFVNYICIWDELNIKSINKNNFIIFLWPESNIWNTITKRQKILAQAMIDRLRELDPLKNTIYIKFHPRHYVKLKESTIDNFIEEFSRDNNLNFKSIKYLSKNIPFDLLPIELIYFYKMPNNLCTIDFGSAASWNLSALPNTKIYSLQFDLRTYLLEAISKKALIARLFLTLLVRKGPKNIFLKKSFKKSFLKL